MAEVLLRRRSGLIMAPADGLAEHEIERMPMGRDLLCTLKRHRSNPSNRHYWACLHVALENIDQNISARALHKFLLKNTGYVIPIVMRSGRVEYVEDSTAFDQMKPDRFQEYKAQALGFIEQAFGIETAPLRAEGADLLGGGSESDDAAGAGVSASSSQRGRA